MFTRRFLPCLFVFTPLAFGSCYFHDGSDTALKNEEYYACSDNGVSQCCMVGDICITNGLCMSPQWGKPYRGACTDKDWANSTVCPPICVQLYPSGYGKATQCNPNFDGVWQWWCGDTSGGAMCTSGGPSDSYFDWKNASFERFVPADGTSIVVESATNPAPSPSSSALSTSSSTNCPSQVGETDRRTSSKTALSVGLGIGIPSLIAFICILILYLRARKQAREMTQQIQRLLSERSYSIVYPEKPVSYVGIGHDGPGLSSPAIRPPHEVDSIGQIAELSGQAAPNINGNAHT